MFLGRKTQKFKNNSMSKNAGHSLGKSGHRQISLKWVSGYRLDLSWLHYRCCLMNNFYVHHEKMPFVKFQNMSKETSV